MYFVKDSKIHKTVFDIQPTNFIEESPFWVADTWPDSKFLWNTKVY
jgi:hypothetical protein